MMDTGANVSLFHKDVEDSMRNPKRSKLKIQVANSDEMQGETEGDLTPAGLSAATASNTHFKAWRFEVGKSVYGQFEGADLEFVATFVLRMILSLFYYISSIIFHSTR
jgi:hypothetical protein